MNKSNIRLLSLTSQFCLSFALLCYMAYGIIRDGVAYFDIQWSRVKFGSGTFSFILGLFCFTAIASCLSGAELFLCIRSKIKERRARRLESNKT